jgi:hypothetical protein
MISPETSQAFSRQHHDLASGFVLLHQPVCLNDLIQVEEFSDLHD